ncbi:MAG: protein kinase [Actinobacteria bacterium]|nr:protein kinase [Actinomycetota bacterium]
MQVRVLGPVAADDQGREVALGGPRQRRLLAVLVLGDGRPVAIDTIVEAVWADGDAPDSPAKTLQSYVSRLRGVLGDSTLINTPAGYCLDLSNGLDLDARLFEAQLARARRSPAVEALELIETALARWRGPAFGDLADEMWCRPAATRLEELRLVAIEERNRTLLELGRSADVIADLERLTRQHPLRERFRSQLMLALHRAGRQAEALRAFHHYRAYLADEIGLEPSAELADLDRQIAAADPTLRVTASGREVRGYVLTEVLGQGTFGTVYRAVQPAVDRDVAVKVVRAELADDPEYVRRFESEARMVARLEHPHIVPLYDFWREPGAAYLVFRLLRGGSVEAQRSASGPWPIERVVRLVREIGSALEAAHRADVVHRDVKPGNMLFDEDGNAYLADFGIALSAARSDGVPDGLASAGSPQYASPEQRRDGLATHLSDQYALAVVAWELLAGRALFDASRATEVLSQQRIDAVPDLCEVRPAVTADMAAALARATSVCPQDRFEDMAAFVDAFEDAAHRPAAALTASRGRSSANGDSMSEGNGPRPGATGLPNPYRGLRAFEEADAGVFFGRGDDVAELADQVARERFVVVTGPSGSGKTSLVRAGLIPRLREQGALVTVAVPGSRPFEEVADAIVRVSVDAMADVRGRLADPAAVPALLREALPSGSELVLVLDQFEELWTQADTAERDRTLAAVAAAVQAPDSRVRVVATLRADYYDRPLGDPVLGPLMRRGTFAIAPLGAADLAAAITGPAAHVGVRTDPGLVAALAADVAAAPGSLPLLQYALTELYEQRSKGTMSADAYRKIGGIGGALHRRAESVMDTLGGDDVAAARRVFTRLVAPGDGSDDARRRLRRHELVSVPSVVLERFGAARLLTFDVDPFDREPTVEIAHESLLRHWPRLREWITHDRSAQRVHLALHAAATAWHDGGRQDDDLLRGPRLADAAALRAEPDHELTELEAEFLETSMRRQSRSRRRARTVMTVLAVLAVFSTVAAALAVGAGRRADRNADLAALNEASAREREREAAASEAEALAARDASAFRRLLSDAAGLASTQRELSLLLAVEAYRREPSVASEGALATALTAEPGVLRFVSLGVEGVQSRSAIVAAGGTVAVMVEGTALTPSVVVVDGTTLRPTGVIIELGEAGTMQLRPDGRELAVSLPSGVVRRFDTRSGRPRAPDIPIEPGVNGPWPITYLPDGALVVGSGSQLQVVGPEASTPDIQLTMQGLVWAMASSPDGAGLVVSTLEVPSTNSGVWAVDLGTGEVRPLLMGHPAPIIGLAFAESSEVLAIDLPEARPAQLFGVALDGSGMQRSLELQSLPRGLHIRADGRILVSFTGSYLLVERDLRPQARSAALVGAIAELLDGTLVSTANGGLVVIDLEEHSSVGETLRVDGEVLRGYFSLNQDGSVLLVDQVDGLQRYRSDTLEKIGFPVSIDLAEVDVKFALSPDARTIAAVRVGETRLFDAATGDRLWSSPGPGGFIRPVFSPDGSSILVTDIGGSVHRLDARDGTIQWSTLLAPELIIGTGWSADGRLVTASTFASERVWVLDAATGEVAQDHQIGWAGVVTPDLDHVAIVGPGTPLRFVSLTDGGVRVLPGGAGLQNVIFSPDGTRLIGQGLQGQLRVIDVESGEQIGVGLVVADDFTGRYSAAVVGSQVLIGAPGEPIVAYELDAKRRATIACNAAGRNLTREEWDRYLGDIGPYRETCPTGVR